MILRKKISHKQGFKRYQGFKPHFQNVYRGILCSINSKIITIFGLDYIKKKFTQDRNSLTMSFHVSLGSTFPPNQSSAPYVKACQLNLALA